MTTFHTLHVVALTCHYHGKIALHLLQSPNFAYQVVGRSVFLSSDISPDFDNLDLLFVNWQKYHEFH
jgi:hypothetical protein